MLTLLKDRACISIEGEDRFKFLQGLISNDIIKNKKKLIYACMLTPQGRYFVDMFLYPYNDSIFIRHSSASKRYITKKAQHV